MNRTLFIAVLVSVLLHAGVAGGGFLFKKKPASAPAAKEVPVIELTLPPPPEPEEPEVFENNLASESPAAGADLAPPMQADMPSAGIDTPFPQPPQLPPPPSLARGTGAFELPKGPPRPGVGGSGLGKVFSLGDLDEKLELRFRPPLVYPFEMRRAGITGEVGLEFVVDPQGDVRNPVVVRSTHPGFEQAALDAVLRWKFKPGKRAGTAVSTRVRMPITFELE